MTLTLEDLDELIEHWYDGGRLSAEQMTAVLHLARQHFEPRPEGMALAAFESRALELEGYVSDRAKQEQKHLEAGTEEREYWHYGYMMALRDVLKRCKPQRSDA